MKKGVEFLDQLSTISFSRTAPFNAVQLTLADSAVD
jgi:hypothetical protein